MKRIHIFSLLGLVVLATGCTTRVGPRTGITREQAIQEMNVYLRTLPGSADEHGIHHQHTEITRFDYGGTVTRTEGYRWNAFHPYSSMTEVGIKRSALGLILFGVMDPTLGSGIYVKHGDARRPEVLMAPLGLYSFFPFYFVKPAALQVRKPAETLEALRLNQFDPPPATATETK